MARLAQQSENSTLQTPMDRVVESACAFFNMPMGLVSILGDQQLKFRSLIGIEDASVPPQLSVTRQLVEAGSGSLLFIPDTLLDGRVREHPFVTGELAIRSFAGATVSLCSGQPVGLICVLGRTPRDAFSSREIVALQRFARMAGDILDSSHAERRQEEQLAMLKLAESLASVGHWRLDLKTGQLDGSDEARRIHGLAPATPVRLDEIVSLYDLPDQQTVAGVFNGIIPPGDSYLSRLSCSAGSPRIVRSSAQLEYDEDGELVGVFGVVRDITAREAERAALIESEEKYRLLAENLGDVIARVNSDWVIDYVSPAATALLGYDVEAVMGAAVHKFIHVEDWPTVRRLVIRNTSHGKGGRIQHRAIHKDGQAIWVESHFRQLIAEDGCTRSVVLTLSDISERRRLEQEWITARDRAEAADKAKSEFLANMSHELRTPLTSVIGFSGLLEASAGLSTEQARYVDRIGTASKALLGVINDILDYSKLEAEAVSLEERPFRLLGLIEGAVGIFEDQCRQRRVSLIVDCAPELPAILIGDEGRLRQVLLNLLSNAMKFTASGQISLRVRTCADRLRVEVTDSGIGIPPEKIGLMFGRFSQADASTTRVYGGTGLGLSISRKLIELMGGTIGVQSEVGRGSTFWFETPLLEGDSGFLDAAPSAAPAAMEGLRILVADDVAANRELVTAILTSLGATVWTAANGAEAVDAAQHSLPDIILMDVNMPVMDGLEASRVIRALPAPANSTRIIALTANVLKEQVDRCRAAGMDSHVGKPIEIMELVNAIEQALAVADHGAGTKRTLDG